MRWPVGHEDGISLCGDRCMRDTPTPPRMDLGPGIPTHPLKGPETRDTPPRKDMGPRIPFPCEQKDACENITFPQTYLRAVTNNDLKEKH